MLAVYILLAVPVVIGLRRSIRDRHLDRRHFVSFVGFIAALVAVIAQLNQQIAGLERDLAESFEEHPDVEIYLSQPGLGVVLGARAIAEFGDDRTRFAHPKARKNFAGTSPITKSSGKHKAVLRRFACKATSSQVVYDDDLVIHRHQLAVASSGVTSFSSMAACAVFSDSAVR